MKEELWNRYKELVSINKEAAILHESIDSLEKFIEHIEQSEKGKDKSITLSLSYYDHGSEKRKSFNISKENKDTALISLHILARNQLNKKTAELTHLLNIFKE